MDIANCLRLDPHIALLSEFHAYTNLNLCAEKRLASQFLEWIQADLSMRITAHRSQIAHRLRMFLRKINKYRVAPSMRLALRTRQYYCRYDGGN